MRVGGRLLAVMAIMALFVATLVTTAVADHEQDRDDLQQHCRDHRTAPKDNAAPGEVHSLDVDGTTVWLHYSDDGKSVEFFADEAGTERLTVRFCLKAADRAGGEEVGHEGHVSWMNGGGQIPQISYVVVYEVEDGNGNGEPCEEGAERITITPSEDTNPVNTNHQVRATVWGDQARTIRCPGWNVRFEVESDGNPTPSEGTAVTNDQGQARFTFTNDTAGTDTITACTNRDGSLPASCDGADLSDDSAIKHWVDGDGCPGDGGSIDLQPESDENPINTDHDMTATVTDANGEPCEGANVRFEVASDGNPTPPDGSDTTDAAGEADFTFTNDTAGEDTITSCTNADGSLPASCDQADLSATATKKWVVVGDAEAFCHAALLHLFGEEVFEANPDRKPCMNDDAGPVWLLLDSLGLTGSDIGGFLFFEEDGKIVLTDGETGSITLDVAFSRTRGNEDQAFGEAGVAFVSIADGDDEEQLGLTLLAAEHETPGCESESSGEATVLELRPGGESIAIPGEHTEIDANPLAEVEMEKADQDESMALRVKLLEQDDLEIVISHAATGCE